MTSVIPNDYLGRMISPASVESIPMEGYMVYILICGDNPIVIGHGKRNRARVIFDTKTSKPTTGHIKAIFVRLYDIYSDCNFRRYIILCSDKKEAQEIEKELHNKVGGNNRNIPENVKTLLLKELNPNSTTYLLIQIALRSSYDGLSDLKKWRKDGLIEDETWSEITKRLHL